MHDSAASKILGVNSKTLRELRGWSVTTLALKLGWPLDTVSALEAGRFDATLDDLDALSRCFAVSPFDLMREPNKNVDPGPYRPLD